MMTKRRVSTTYACPACGQRQTVHIPTTAIACTGGRKHKATAMVVVEEPLAPPSPSN